MATYVPGIQEYIPQVQPFKPDFNFFQSALEMKQAQYQAGYNKISSLYGQLLNSDLLRDPNKKRRDTFFTEIDSDIKRLSGVDLSLVENQQQAMGLFQPLIDNDYFRKDLAYTKQYQAQLSKAESLRNNPNPKSDEKYWQEGVTALNYQAEDFAKSSDGESLYFKNPRYTAYINGYEKLFAFAKENDINPEGISFQNGFIVKYTNGVQAIPSLQNIFSSALLSDPRIKDMFTTQAYLERKNYMKSNAEKFGGDEYAAETEYLTNKANEINEYYRKATQQDLDTKNKIGNTKKVIEDNIRTKGVDPDLDQGLVRMYQSLSNDDAVQNSVVEKNKEVTSQFDGIDVNSLDRESLRNRIDGTYSYFLLDDLATKTATSYAVGKAKYDIEVNPYSLEAVKHQNRLIEKAVGFDYDMKLKMVDIAGKLLGESGDGVGGFSLNPMANEGLFIDPGTPGNTSLTNIDIQERNAAQLQSFDVASTKLMLNNAEAFLAEQNQIILNPKATPEQKNLARQRVQDVLGEYQVTEKTAATTKDLPTDVGGALASFGGMLLGTIPNPLFQLFGLGSTRSFQTAISGEEQIPEKVTQTKGLVTKQSNGTYKLVDPNQAVSLTDPNSLEYYFKVNERLKNYADENLTLDPSNPAAAALKSLIDKNSATLDLKKQLIDGIAQISKENNIIISGSLANEAGTNSETAKLYFNPDFTRTRSLNEFTQAYINANKSNTDAYPVERFYGYQSSQVARVSEEERLEDMRDDAEDIYENLTDAYADLKKNPDGSIPVKSFDSALGGEGLNRFMSGAALYAFDPALFQMPGFQYIADFYQKDFKPAMINPVTRNANGARVTFGSGFNITADEYASEDFQHNEEAAKILNHFMSTSFTKGIHKSEKRPRAEVAFHAVAANDGNKVALTFSPSPEYINNNAGTEKEKGITWSLQEKMNSGESTDITFFVDANKALSSGFTAMQSSEEEMLMNMFGKLDINAFSDYGGNLTLTPNALGGLTYTGIVKAINEAGKIIENPVFGTVDAGVNDSYKFYMDMLEGVSKTNLLMLQQMRAQSPNLITDPSALLENEEE